LYVVEANNDTVARDHSDQVDAEKAAPERNLYIVDHVHPDPAYDDEDIEEVFHIGVYSTREKAQQAVDGLKQQPGFCRFPDGFHIDWIWLDQTSWEEGFITDYGEADEDRPGDTSA
jgi:hypothetical protein